VTIGENIVTIGRSAFYGCGGITTVVFNAVLCESMGGSRSSTVFGNCRALSRVTFGPAVTRIPDYAFVGMDGLNCEWKLPAALEYIGEFAFAYCNNIHGELVLPEHVKHIGASAFAQCHAITSVEMPKRIEQLDTRAFYQCIGIKEVNIKALTPPSLGTDVFTGLKANAVYNVPCISIDRYKDVPAWRRIRNLRTTYPCQLDVVAHANDPQCGYVLGGGTYNLGENISLTVICYAGFGFKGWSDGNTENPRSITVNDTAKLKLHAVIQRIM